MAIPNISIEKKEAPPFCYFKIRMQAIYDRYPKNENEQNGKFYILQLSRLAIELQIAFYSTFSICTIFIFKFSFNIVLKTWCPC